MTPLDTIAAEIARPPDAYGDVRVRVFARELLTEVQWLQIELDRLQWLTHAQDRAMAALGLEIGRLQALNVGLVDRCAAASEVLGRIANQQRLTCPNCKNVWTIGNGKLE